MMEWQPINTAPLDTLVLLYLGDEGFAIGESWRTYDEQPYGLTWWVEERGRFYPTHWMPLPEPPK